jgi:hypothetical protein
LRELQEIYLTRVTADRERTAARTAHDGRAFRSDDGLCSGVADERDRAATDQCEPEIGRIEGGCVAARAEWGVHRLESVHRDQS